MSTTGLAGEFRKIRAGTQTSLQLCRLPVRPQGWSGSTDTGPVAEPLAKKIIYIYIGTAILTGLSGPAIHVPDRSANSQTSSPRPTKSETHTVAPQEQLEGSGISRKSYLFSQITAPHLQCWLEEDNVL